MAAQDPRIVVKLVDDLAQTLPYAAGAEAGLPEELQLLWSNIGATFLTTFSLDPALVEIEVEAVRDQLAINSAADGLPIANLLSFFAVSVPPELSEPVSAALGSLPFVEFAYVEPELLLASVNHLDDPMSVGQGYLNLQPIGVGALATFAVAFGDGSNAHFVDVENGWDVMHEDLVDGNGVNQIPMLFTGTTALATNSGSIEHGTAMMGVVKAQDNNRGVVGIAPAVKAMIAPVREPFGATTIASVLAMLLTNTEVPVGTVVLLELQLAGLRPLEMDVLIRHAIRELVRKGMVVVEPAGNGGHDLDQLRDLFFGDVMNPASAVFFDTGAILVAAATAVHPHERLAFSNHGARIDCFAWGELILSCSTNVNPSTGLGYAFTGGTSGASAIIAGCCCVLQGLRTTVIGELLTPARFRELFHLPTLGTLCHPGDDGRIGIMPNLERLSDVVTRP